MKYNSTLVVGKNKTGKTRNILFNEVKDRINNNENLVILDTKKEYYNHFYNMLIEHNYKIDVININEPLKSDGWNPLSYPEFIYRYDKDKGIELLENMARNIFSEENKNNDPFWCNMASNLFIGLSLILFRLRDRVESNTAIAFSSIVALLDLGERKYKDTQKTYLKKYIETLPSHDPVYVALSSILYAPTETKGSIMAVFKVKMNLYIMRENLVKSFINNSTSESNIVTNENRAMFFIGTRSLDKLTNIFFEQVINESLKSKKNVSIIIDGYDLLPTFHNINSSIDLINHSNVNLFLTSTDKNITDEVRKIENIIETTDIYEEENTDEMINLPDLKVNSNYEIDFSDRLSNALESLIEER